MCSVQPLPYPVLKSSLLLPIPFFQPAFLKAMMPGPFTSFPWKLVITMAFPHTSLRAGGPDGCPTDPCPQMGRMRNPRCPHALAPPAFVPLWDPAAPNQPLRPPQLRLLKGKMPPPALSSKSLSPLRTVSSPKVGRLKPQPHSQGPPPISAPETDTLIRGTLVITSTVSSGGGMGVLGQGQQGLS